MASRNYDGTQRQFWTPFNDTFVRKVKSDTPGAISRQNKNGETVWEIHQKVVYGTIIKMEYVERTHNGVEYRYLSITLHDGDVVQLNWGYRVCDCFLYMMENIDFTSEIDFSIAVSEYTDARGVMKRKQTLYLSQNGQSLKWFYTKSSPGLKPEWETYYDDAGREKKGRHKELQYLRKIVEGLNDRLQDANKIHAEDDAYVDASMGVTRARERENWGDPSFAGSEPVYADTEDDLPF